MSISYSIEFAKLIIRYQNIRPEQAHSFFEAIKQEIGEMKLDAQTREELRRQLGTEDTAVNRWKTVDDVLNHVDIVNFAEKHPEVHLALCNSRFCGAKRQRCEASGRT